MYCLIRHSRSIDIYSDNLTDHAQAWPRTQVTPGAIQRLALWGPPTQTHFTQRLLFSSSMRITSQQSFLYHLTCLASSHDLTGVMFTSVYAWSVLGSLTSTDHGQPRHGWGNTSFLARNLFCMLRKVHGCMHSEARTSAI